MHSGTPPHMSVLCVFLFVLCVATGGGGGSTEGHEQRGRELGTQVHLPAGAYSTSHLTTHTSLLTFHDHCYAQLLPLRLTVSSILLTHYISYSSARYGLICAGLLIMVWCAVLWCALTCRSFAGTTTRSSTISTSRALEVQRLGGGEGK